MDVLAKAHRAFRRLSARPVILMYHRVADLPFDPWGLAVTPVHFEEQMRMLALERIPLPMDEFHARAADGTLPAKAIGVTFDDGYADNFEAALPILQRQGVPATFFVSTGFVGVAAEFWWDELARMILGRKTALTGEVELSGEVVHMALPPMDDDAAAAIRAWRASDPPSGPREALYYDLWSRLQKQDETDRTAAIATLRIHCCARPATTGRDFPMTADQVRALASDALVTIGGHSVSHPRLVDLSPQDLASEIREGRKACEDLAGKAVRGFAYPYGALDDDAKAAVRAAGFNWACTTVATSTLARGADALALPRIAANDESADMLLWRMKVA